MADVVQYKLERMVNELDDLESRGLFSRREIAEIVKQRRKFEYRLKRPSPLKRDYLSYIDYEKNLDTLRLLRKKAVARELKKKGNKKMKKSVSDFAGVARIVDIYRLATNRFKGDVELWFQYLEFCRERRNGHMKKISLLLRVNIKWGMGAFEAIVGLLSKQCPIVFDKSSVLAQVIRFHPKVAGVWIYAASWEFDYNLNVAAARALMQSGLRACPTSEDLWVEYLRMELTYLNKLKARKVALGEDSGKLIHDPEDKQWQDENQELFMSLDEKRESHEGKKIDLFGEQGFSILQTVYSGAVEALPSSFSLRTRFLEILEAINLAHSDEMRKVYEEALKTLPSSLMVNLYTKFLMDVIVYKNGETRDSGLLLSSSGNTIDHISQVLKVYENAERIGCINEDLACQHISLFLDLGRLDEARNLAEKFCNGKLSHAVDLWVLRISIEMRSVQNRSPSPSEDDVLVVFELLRNALMKVAVSKAENLWHMALKFFANQRRYFKKLVEISLNLLARDGGSDDGFSLSSAIVNFVLQKDGIQNARDIYKRFLALPHPGLAIYKNCVELELNLASAGDKDCLVKARKIYESALSAYDQDVSLWQDYYSMESKMGTSETAAAVHWRARKVLGGNISFLS
ncbi:hypothetical protein LguiA_015145 [Lonicera macranthoides]